MVEFLYSYTKCYLLVGMLLSRNLIELESKKLLKNDEKKGKFSKSHFFFLNNLHMEQLFTFIMNIILDSLVKIR
ncbi:hypothetical protein COD67_05070 [Bacillus cereus]|nr:hypothetical protein COI89_01500 [Bacillus cereus]PGU69262.1 hypothetical protein COD67_05070 [Bacillus cereus]